MKHGGVSIIPWGCFWKWVELNQDNPQGKPVRGSRRLGSEVSSQQGTGLILYGFRLKKIHGAERPSQSLLLRQNYFGLICSIKISSGFVFVIWQNVKQFSRCFVFSDNQKTCGSQLRLKESGIKSFKPLKLLLNFKKPNEMFVIGVKELSRKCVNVPSM